MAIELQCLLFCYIIFFFSFFLIPPLLLSLYCWRATCTTCVRVHDLLVYKKKRKEKHQRVVVHPGDYADAIGYFSPTTLCI
jgi:hypothetical protein